MFGKKLAGKTPEQLLGMRVAGLLVGRTLQLLAEAVRPGMTTLELDRMAEEFIRGNGGIPNFQLVPGYRHTLCTSVNEEVVHGIPSDRVLLEGDLLSIDCGAEVAGWNGDAAFTCVVGGDAAGRPEDLKLSAATRASLWAGIAAMGDGRKLHDIGAAVEDSAHASSIADGVDYGIVEDYVGHGIGRQMHMAPQIPNYRVAGRSPIMSVGFTGAVEPMLTLGSPDTAVLADEWTVIAKDKSRASHWEHSIAVTPGGLWVLTAVDGGEAGLTAIGAGERFAPID